VVSPMRSLLSLSLIVLLTGCPCVGRYVWQIGDSTAYLISEELHAAGGLRDVGDALLVLGAAPGFALGTQNDYFVGRLESAKFGGRCGAPDWVLIQLGTNDLFTYDPATGGFDSPVDVEIDAPGELDVAIARLVDAVPESARILWVMPGPGVAQDRRSYLRAGLERSPRKIEVLELPSEIYGDGIHFRDEQKAAVLIVAEMDRLEAQP